VCEHLKELLQGDRRRVLVFDDDPTGNIDMDRTLVHAWEILTTS